MKVRKLFEIELALKPKPKVWKLIIIKLKYYIFPNEKACKIWLSLCKLAQTSIHFLITQIHKGIQSCHI